MLSHHIKSSQPFTELEICSLSPDHIELVVIVVLTVIVVAAERTIVEVKIL